MSDNVKERGSVMSDETTMSIEAVRKALLEKEREKLLGEFGPARLSDSKKAQAV